MKPDDDVFFTAEAPRRKVFAGSFEDLCGYLRLRAFAVKKVELRLWLFARAARLGESIDKRNQTFCLFLILNVLRSEMLCQRLFLNSYTY